MTPIERRKLALDTIDSLSQATDVMRTLHLPTDAVDRIVENLETVWGMWLDEDTSLEQQRRASALLIRCAARLQHLHSAVSDAVTGSGHAF
jgi:hypothetical protein